MRDVHGLATRMCVATARGCAFVWSVALTGRDACRAGVEGREKISLRGFYGYKECKFGNCGWNYQ